MDIEVGYFVDVFHEILKNDNQYGLGRVHSIDENGIKVEILMTENGTNEGDIYLFDEKDLMFAGNKRVTVYEDYLKWKKVGRKVYEYKVGDIIKDVVSLELLEVEYAKDGEIIAWYMTEDGIYRDEFYKDNSCYHLVCKVEDRLDKYFKDEI